MNKKSLLGGVAVITALLIVVVVGSFWQDAEAEKRYKKGYIEYGIQIKTASMEKASHDRRQKFIDHARVIRSKWELWAKRHKDLLLAMKKDQNKQMFERLAKELPARKDTTISRDDLGGKFNFSDKDERLRKILFTWEPLGSGQRIPEVDNYLWKLFSEYKTFPLSRSMEGAGRSWITVLTDGRIIETVMEDNPNRSSGQPAYIEVIKAIDPPFDFLQ